MKEVIEAFGGAVQLADFYSKPSMEYDQFVYPLMESGCPVILNVRGRNFSTPQDPHRSEEFGHALAVMGHTLNTDRWEPEARGGYGSYCRENYVPAVSWTDHLIINDDNFGMFVTLPTDSLRNLLIPQKNPGLHAAAAMGIVPKEVKLSGLFAEQRAAWAFAKLAKPGAFSPPPYWLQKLAGGPLVCRTILQTRGQYVQHLAATLAPIGQALTPPLQANLCQLPPWLWVVELTVPQLYAANRHKAADVILDATAEEATHMSGVSLMAMRLPGHFVFFNAKVGHSFPITGHTPLISKNDEIRLCDW
jgi:hypothetical protein